MFNSNNISCFYYKLEGGRLIQNSNNACWAGIRNFMRSGVEEIYIDYRSNKEELKPHLKLLVRIINKITPCSLVTIEKKEYIKYKFLSCKKGHAANEDHYNRNLLLLNFIRNLWHNPYSNYSKKFFEKLKSSTYIDPMKRLTVSNQVGCADYKNVNYGLGHCNVYTGCQIKSMKDFEEHEFHDNTRAVATQAFLTKKTT